MIPIKYFVNGPSQSWQPELDAILHVLYVSGASSSKSSAHGSMGFHIYTWSVSQQIDKPWDLDGMTGMEEFCHT